MYTWVGEEIDGEGQARAFRIYYDEQLIGRVVEVDTDYYNVFVDAGGEEVQINEGLLALFEARQMLQDRAVQHG